MTASFPQPAGQSRANARHHPPTGSHERLQADGMRNDRPHHAPVVRLAHAHSLESRAARAAHLGTRELLSAILALHKYLTRPFAVSAATRTSGSPSDPATTVT